MSVAPVVVTITPNVERFHAALNQAAAAFQRLTPHLWRHKRAASRDRSRAVTRRKQRRHW